MDICLLDNERIDDLQRSNLKIIQNTKNFCFGMDAVLLSSFVTARKGERVLDLGTGTGIIPLLLTAKTNASHFTGLELQAQSAEMAARSVSLNKLDDTVDIVTGDIKEAGQIFGPASFEVVTTNPPYMIDNHGIKNPDEPKAIARHEIACNLEDVIRAAAQVLTDNGRFYMVHRPFRLADIICLMRQYAIEPKKMQLVYPFVDKEPNMVLIEGYLHGKPRMTVEKPLIIYDEPGKYTKEVLEVYGY